MAQADPPNDQSVTLTLSNCSGPAGTPTTFDVTKIPNGGQGLDLVDGTGVLVLHGAIDLTTGEIAAPLPQGFEQNDLSLVPCTTTSPNTGHRILVSGFLTPVGAH